MEIVLQWLDDLDDLIFAGALLWDRLRMLCLGIGLIAAVALHVASRWQIPPETTLVLIYVPLCSIVSWSVIWLAGHFLHQRAERYLETA